VLRRAIFSKPSHVYNCAYMERRAVIALGILLACCRCASALNPSPAINQYAHTAWTVREGFSKGVIFSIAQTPDGYLWLGTEFGLLRFDGVRNVAWQPPAGQLHIMSYYSEHVALQIPGTFMQGKTAVREQFVRPFITGFPGNRHVAKSMIFGRDVVVVEWSFEAEHKGPFAGRDATGVRVEVPGCPSMSTIQRTARSPGDVSTSMSGRY
jgi:SnoaL-like polyketide cyclase/Two component regulator propeller